MKIVFVITALLLSGVSAYADTQCVPTGNGGYRCYYVPKNCNQWTIGGCG